MKRTTALWPKTDTLTITTSTSQLIITSVHYTVIAKELDCEDYLITNLWKWPWSLSLCQCVLLEKSQLETVSWRRFLHAKSLMIVSMSVSLRISSETRVLSFCCPIKVRRWFFILGNLEKDNSPAVPSPRGFWGLYSRNKAPSVQIELWSTVNRWSFCHISECQPPLKKCKASILKVFWWRFLLSSTVGRHEAQVYAKAISVFGKAECSSFSTINKYIRNSIHFPSLWSRSEFCLSQMTLKRAANCTSCQFP